MSEKGMRRRVVKALKPLDAVSVENSVYAGTPDVNYAEGWLELKWVRSWPKNRDTPLRVPHFTQQQKLWLTRRWRSGGAAYLLLKVSRDWLLFDGPTAAKVLGTSTRQELRENALRVWPRGLAEKELVRELRYGRQDLS